MKNIKFALIGTGNIAHRHAKAILSIKNSELIGVFGRDYERTKKFAAKYNINTYTDLNELLKNKEIDAVDIVTLNNLHADLGIQSAKSGKHVLIEKPIDISLEKAKDLIKICKDNNVKLSVISQHRFDKAVMWLKKEIDNGTFGDIILSNTTIIWKRSKDYFDTSNMWRKSKKISGGGVLIMKAIHNIDILLWLLGDVKSVYGKVCTKVHELEVEDTAAAILKFKSGTLANINATIPIKNLKDKIEIYGKNGYILLEEGKLINRIKKLYIKDSSISKRFSRYINFNKGTIKDQVKDFVNSIIQDKDPSITGEDGLKALEIVLSIYKSAELNKEIKIST